MYGVPHVLVLCAHCITSRAHTDVCECAWRARACAHAHCPLKPLARAQVVDFPAFIVCDDKGNDFFKEFNM